jgi:hypothetical protein
MFLCYRLLRLVYCGLNLCVSTIVLHAHAKEKDPSSLLSPLT